MMKNHTYKIIPISLCLMIGMAVSGCQKKVDNLGNEALQWHSFSDSITYLLPKLTEMDLDAENGPNCRILIDITYPESNEKRYKKIADDLKEEIFKIVFDYNYIPHQSVDSLYRRMVESRVEEYRADIIHANTPSLDLEMLGVIYARNKEVTNEVIYNDHNFVSVHIIDRYYEGGAHAYDSNKYINYDLEKGEQILLSSLLLPENEEDVRRLIITELQKIFEVSTDEELEASGIYSVDEVDIAENFALTDEGITFVYNTSDIAPFAIGELSVEIPYDKIAPYINPKYSRLYDK